jgi:membrane-associated phospholipid phosphatase
LLNKQDISYNPFFFVPFILWVVAGSILLAQFSGKDLFFAVNTHYNDTLDNLMYHISWMGEGQIIIAVLIGLLIVPRFRNWWYFFTALFCNIIPFFIQQLLKMTFKSPRPLNYFHHAEWIHWNNKWPYLTENSFPSGHSAGAFSFFCFLALLMPKRYQPLGLLFFLLALSVCYSRIYLTAHFFADVYSGSILGTVITTTIFIIMTMYKSRFAKPISNV